MKTALNPMQKGEFTISHYIAAYDIADDRQREKVADVLKRYGERLQRSVFMVDLETKDIVELQFQLGKLLGEFDLLDIVPIADAPHRPYLRWNKASLVDDFVVVD